MPATLFAISSLTLLLASPVSAAKPADDSPPAPAIAAPMQQQLGSFEIVSVTRARAFVNERKVHALDTRPVAKYLAGHLPRAVHIDDEVLRGSSGGLPVEFLPAGELARVFERAGVTAERPVLVYSDGEDPLAATIAAYALLKAGHPRVLLLDGGFEAWRGVADVSQEYGAYPTAPWTLSAPTVPIAASLDDVRRMVDTAEGVLVDARPARVFRGEGKPWPRNGHIPGAVNLDWKSLVRGDNEALFRPRKEIEPLLREAGLDGKSPTIVYCGTGREATLLYLYLKCVLQWPRVTLYEGSWTEWSSNPSLPVEIGDEPVIPVYADGDVFIGGQPSEAQLRELADRGVTLLINCRTAGEAASVPFSQSSLAKSLGMRFIEIPLGGDEGFAPEDVAALKAALEEAREEGRTSQGGGKVLLYCASGGRATTLWIAHLVVNGGLTLEAAQDRARAAGMLRRSGLERLLDQDTVLRAKP